MTAADPPLQRVYLQMLGTVAIWGGAWLCGRVISSAGIPALEGSLGRFLFGSLGMLLILTARKAWFRLPNELWWKVFLMALTGVFLYNICFFEALKRLPAGRASLMAALQPSVIYLYSVLFLNEKLLLSKVAGILLSLTGAMLVLTQGNLPQLLATGFGTGDLWAFGCVATWAAYTLLSRYTLKAAPALPVTSYSTWLGTLMLLALWIAKGSSVRLLSAPGSVWIAVAYIGLLGTSLAFLWFVDGIEKLGAASASIFINLVPVFAVLFSALVLDETITAWTVGGGMLAIAGVRLVNKPG
jgi:drug/metabolite transporter (DMT)-like permease